MRLAAHDDRQCLPRFQRSIEDAPWLLDPDLQPPAAPL
jgi:hypothetical protein